jgi:hypothetical protein
MDTCVQMMEDNVLKYVEWSECTKRSQELFGVRKDAEAKKGWQPDAHGVVKEVLKAEPLTASVSTDWQLHKALQRRSVAMEVGGICMFEDAEKITDRFIRELHRDPLDGYKAVSVNQLIRADKRIWRRIAELTRSGIQRRADGSKPVADAITAVLLEAETNLLLVQMLCSSSSGGTKRSSEVADDSDKKKSARLEAENDRLEGAEREEHERRRQV